MRRRNNERMILVTRHRSFDGEPTHGKTGPTVSHQSKETDMTNRIGNKDVAQQRSKEEKKRTKASNIAMEAEKKEKAAAKSKNAVKGQPTSKKS